MALTPVVGALAGLGALWAMAFTFRGQLDVEDVHRASLVFATIALVTAVVSLWLFAGLTELVLGVVSIGNAGVSFALLASAEDVL